MSKDGVVPHGEALRKAVHWMAQQPRHDRSVLNEAGQRFDLTPLEQEFLARHFGPWDSRPEGSE